MSLLKIALTRGLILLAIAILPALPATGAPKPAPKPAPCLWKAAVAVVKITPEKPMWMSGYAARKKPSEGVAQDLFAKCLALEDSSGNRLVIVSLDLIGVVTSLREAVEKRLQTQYKLPPECLLMAASHTHSGPAYHLGKDPQDERGRYHKFLEEQIVKMAGECLKGLSPARLSYGHARAGFAMNRRRNYQLPKGDVNFNKAPNPDGPVDHDVPVLLVSNPDDTPRALVFGYACHSTTLGFYQFCGDYGGYAQEYLQADHPAVTALFVAGCGADQNPYPRSTFDWAKKHGRSLANAVEAALFAGPRPVAGPVRCAFAKVELERQGKPAPKFDYPVQVIRFGPELTMVALASEVVVDYSLRLKHDLQGARGVWVAGYTNGYYGYIASRRIVEEGGYEASGNWTPAIEERIVGKVQELNRRLGVEPAAPPIDRVLKATKN